jgi:hypothetical protein
MPPKIYCEPGALSKHLRELHDHGAVTLVHFAFDPGSHTRKIPHEASPSGAQWRDLDYTWDQLGELGITWDDLKARGRIAEIQAIIGPENRRDALHANSAYLSGCVALVTRDHDILDHRPELEGLLGLRFFHPDSDEDLIDAFVASVGAV